MSFRHLVPTNDSSCPPASLPAWSCGYGLREPSSGNYPGSEPTTTDFDGIWKEVLQSWLPECMALFWPRIHALIDWSTPPTFLHQELQRLHKIMKRGAKRTDLLAQVNLKTGARALLLLHIEIEAGHIDISFNKRMFDYRILLCAKHPDQAILSCAILLDRKKGQNTEIYVHGGFGDTLTFEFPVVNLASWQDRVAELEVLAPSNPFAVVILAQLECRATQPDTTRLASKLKLAHALEKWNHGPAVRGEVFRIIDSLLTLPPELDQRFIEILEQSEEPAMLQQLSCIDRYLLKKERTAGEEVGLQKGLHKGHQEGAAKTLSTLIAHKFGAVPQWAQARLQQAGEADLNRWTLRILDAQRLEDIFEE